MRRTYKSPPIAEALVELQFDGGDWDLTVPGRLQGVLKDEYPGKPRQQNIVSANRVLTQNQPAAMQAVQALGKVQLPSADGQKLVAIGPNSLSVHILQKYTGWEDLKPRVTRALDEYVKLVEPRAVARIGVRYVNRVVLPDGAELGVYFTRAAREAGGLPRRITNFVYRDEYRYEDDVQLLVTFASLQSDGAPAYLLDIDVVDLPSTPIDLTRVGDRIEDLRDRERNVFEALITERARELFNAE